MGHIGSEHLLASQSRESGPTVLVLIFKLQSHLVQVQRTGSVLTMLDFTVMILSDTTTSAVVSQTNRVYWL